MTRRTPRARTTTSRTRRRGSSSPETQLTGAFNRLVDQRPVVAAIVLAVVALAAWFFLRDTGESASGPVTGSQTTQHAGTPEPTSTSTAPHTTTSAGSIDPASGLPIIAASDLPPKAREVLAAIKDGGPFEYDEDGDVFGNYEGILPGKKRGYYHEYTVRLPGDKTRGAHRLVTGDKGEIYWTADHYESFSRVKEDA